MARQRRSRAGVTSSSRQASDAPPAVYQGTLVTGSAIALVVGAVVEMVSVAVPDAAPVMLTGVVEPKLTVGGCTAPVGLEVMAAVSATLPVNPPEGVMVIKEVFAVVAPGAIVGAVPEMVKAGGGGGVTVTKKAGPEAVLKMEELAQQLTPEGHTGWRRQYIDRCRVVKKFHRVE